MNTEICNICHEPIDFNNQAWSVSNGIYSHYRCLIGQEIQLVSLSRPSVQSLRDYLLPLYQTRNAENGWIYEVFTSLERSLK